jgi:hypothetical protein
MDDHPPQANDADENAIALSRINKHRPQLIGNNCPIALLSLNIALDDETSVPRNGGYLVLYVMQGNVIGQLHILAGTWEGALVCMILACAVTTGS